MRKQAKPVSGHITSRRAASRPTNLQLQFQQQHQSSNNNLNETFVVDERSSAKHPATPTGKGIAATRRIGGAGSPASRIRSPAVSKKAKQKWEVLDRKVRVLKALIFSFQNMSKLMTREVSLET